MKQNFAKALERVLVYEGGYSNHPRDPGGPTNKGIIQRVYDGFRRSKGLEPRSVRRLTREELLEIYRRQYWDKVQGDRLPDGVDFVVFDGAVNSGFSQSTKWLQRALGMERVDGELGEATIAAALAHPDHDALIADICARRLGMLQRLSTWDAFGKGWGRRVANVKAIGQAWATGSVGPQPVAVHEIGGDAKALVADVALPKVSAEAATQGTLGGGAIAAAVNGGKESLLPLVGSNKTVDLVFTVLTLAGIAIALGGAAYALWAARQRRQAERVWSAEARAEVDDWAAVDLAFGGPA
ncbi:glycoside hydrolase family 108 protein [Rhodoplanes sp. TEM]|uniref:Glycoside hydrolase family 108 protein n=1 Tax=Rhodoplanes tepidamans TaxID=200616 RepID=A0ABT5JCV6_RHOTP|nr:MULTISPECIES: glycoside hydrolase family 108 protein [Rhodoplanes]MDC7787343.1 glycoside hydrolase family 108 protein [Rhodoplanes tepidamans]MDC7984775.1 glycoside hydrolase family 108 protein [Rhodoplanes sp. TEM]MDQ0358254.1 lysozyme family protein [Rhodoplanes tepidamans]